MSIRPLKSNYKLFLFLVIGILATGCKKDSLTVDRIKEYEERGHVSLHAYDSGWHLALQPDGAADITPGGDIIYRGTYKIKGSKLIVNTPQNSDTYSFSIISKTELREDETGITLDLK